MTERRLFKEVWFHRCMLIAISALMSAFMLQNALAEFDPDEEAPIPENTDAGRQNAWIGSDVTLGHYYRLWSIKAYDGYKNWAVGIYKEWESSSGTLFYIPVNWDWNLKLKYERLEGTIELVPAQVPDEDRTGGPYYTTLDHDMLALILFRRLVIFPDVVIHPTVHLGFGLSLLSDKILEEGTLYNYNIVGGVGLEYLLGEDWVATADVQWEHFSNGGRMYLTDAAVIGLESVQVVLGLRYKL